MPLPQDVQTEAPPNEAYVPLWHPWQEELRDTLLYVPIPQDVQAEAPESDAYVPLWHARQVLELYAPMLMENEPIAHGVHSLAPGDTSPQGMWCKR